MDITKNSHFIIFIRTANICLLRFRMSFWWINFIWSWQVNTSDISGYWEKARYLFDFNKVSQIVQAIKGVSSIYFRGKTRVKRIQEKNKTWWTGKGEKVSVIIRTSLAVSYISKKRKGHFVCSFFTTFAEKFLQTLPLQLLQVLKGKSSFISRFILNFVYASFFTRKIKIITKILSTMSSNTCYFQLYDMWFLQSFEDPLFHHCFRLVITSFLIRAL